MATVLLADDALRNAMVGFYCAGCGTANEPQARAAGAPAFVEKGGSPAGVISTVLELLNRSDPRSTRTWSWLAWGVRTIWSRRSPRDRRRTSLPA